MTDPWIALRRVTPARIALGHAGAGLPTVAHLEFQLAHARARDAVVRAFDPAGLCDALRAIHDDVRAVHTEARDRTEYLSNPQKGTRLDGAARALLADAPKDADIVFVVADGLSSAAVMRHAPPLLARVVPSMRSEGKSVGPIVVVSEGRVAVGDDVGGLLRARIAVVLIGERPGLSAPDSMGTYITYAPQPGRTNAERDCISNVRPDGLGYDAAAVALMEVMVEAIASRRTGVRRDEEMMR